MQETGGIRTHSIKTEWVTKSQCAQTVQKSYYSYGQMSCPTFAKGFASQKSSMAPLLTAWCLCAGGWGPVMIQGPRSWTQFMEITDIYCFKAWSQMCVRVRRTSPPHPLYQ